MEIRSDLWISRCGTNKLMVSFLEHLVAGRTRFPFSSPSDERFKRSSQKSHVATYWHEGYLLQSQFCVVVFCMFLCCNLNRIYSSLWYWVTTESGSEWFLNEPFTPRSVPGLKPVTNGSTNSCCLISKHYYRLSQLSPRQHRDLAADPEDRYKRIVERTRL